MTLDPPVLILQESMMVYPVSFGFDLIFLFMLYVYDLVLVGLHYLIYKLKTKRKMEMEKLKQK